MTCGFMWLMIIMQQVSLCCHACLCFTALMHSVRCSGFSISIPLPYSPHLTARSRILPIFDKITFLCGVYIENKLVGLGGWVMQSLHMTVFVLLGWLFGKGQRVNPQGIFSGWSFCWAIGNSRFSNVSCKRRVFWGL